MLIQKATSRSHYSDRPTWSQTSGVRIVFGMDEPQTTVLDPTPPTVRPGPEGGKRARNRQMRLAQLRDAALPLFIEQGVERVTIDDIVQAAGVAKGSFYRYYPDKEALVEAVVFPVRAALEEALDAGGAELGRATTWDAVVDAYNRLGLVLAPVLVAHSDVVLLYLQENRAPAVGARRPIRALADLIRDRAIELTDVAHTHGLLRPVPHRVSALAVVGAVERLLFEVLDGGDVGDPIEAATSLVTMVLDGLRAPA